MRALSALVFWIATARALYEDQIGGIDWYRQFLGSADYVALDGATPQGCKRVLVASRSGVVASVDAETGEIAWRHVYETGKDGVIDVVLRSKWGLVTVSRRGGLLRSWDVSSGTLRWESLTGLSYKEEGEGKEGGEEQLEYPLSAEWKPGAVVATLAGSTAETIVVAVGAEVVGFKGRSGERMKLEFDSSFDPVISYINSTDEAYLTVLSSSVGERVVTHRVKVSDGAAKKRAEFPSPWLTAASTCGVVLGGVVTCLDPETQSLYHGTGERFLRSDLKSLGVSGVNLLQISEDGSELWVHSDHTHWMLSIRDNIVTVTKKVANTLLLETELGEGESVRVGVRWEQGGGGEEGEEGEEERWK